MIVYLSIFIFKIHFLTAVVDPREGPPYLLTKLRPEGAKKFFGDQAPPYLKVWIRYCPDYLGPSMGIYYS